MKFKELLSLVDDDAYVKIVDFETEQSIECDACNSMLEQLSDGIVESIYTGEELIIRVDFEKKEAQNDTSR